MDGEQFNPRLKVVVAEEVRVLLARRRLSGVQLAKLMGVTQAYLSRRLNGGVAFDLDDLERIARALDITVFDLMPAAASISSPSRQTGTVKRMSDLNDSSPRLLRAATDGSSEIASRRPINRVRHDATRPVSAVPLTRRRPVFVRPGERPIPRG